MDPSLPPSAPRVSGLNRFAGFLLAACMLVMLIAISHHPVAPRRRGLEALEAIVALGPTDRIVHGVLVLIIFAMIFSFTVYTLNRVRLPLGVTAWVAFFAGNMSVIGAVLTDGFFVPGFAESYLRSAPADATPALAILNAAAVAIQVLTRFGFLAICAAVLLWSIDLILDRGQARLIGVLGVIATIAVVAMLFLGGTINVHSLMVIVGLQALWYLAIAYRMISAPPETIPQL
jgi:hypothetical protein